MKKRVYFWDNYKGLLIFLVVFGHYIHSYSNKLPDSFARDLYVFIYSFHMPAFIFSSGYFSKSEHSRSMESLVKLFLYYIAFNTLMAFFSYFYMGSSLKFLTPYNSYWYMLSLIVWRGMIKQLSRVKYLVPISFLIALLSGYSSQFTNSLSVRRTIAFFCFFAAGYLLDREKVDIFLERRKIKHIVLSAVGVLFAVVAVFWAIEYFKITGTMTMMSAYGKNSTILHRALIMVISIAAIIGMFLVIPNCEIPLLSKIGRNSLLIYLAHRFFTIIFYRDIFPYRSYSRWYLVYALIATIITCAVFSSNRLNQVISNEFNKAASAVCDHNSKGGKQIIFAIVMVFFIMLCIVAAPEIMEILRDFSG